MKRLGGKFKVGEYQGQQVNKEFPFEYVEFETLDEARQSKDWGDKSLLDLINSNEKATAKANEYQKVTAPYRPDTSTPEFKREQMIKTFVSMWNVPRDIAEQQVDALIAQGEQATT
jgi:hypothetical protein